MNESNNTDMTADTQCSPAALAAYQRLDQQAWQTQITADCGTDWRENWVLDGTCCTLSNSDAGLRFTSGAEAGNHANHGVLWTKQSFPPTMKVEFDFIRLDHVNRWVNILYFNARGTGEGAYATDIHQWADLRTVSYMQTYFDHMDLLHISFAAFGNSNDLPEDYIRVRRYPVSDDRDFDQMEVDGTLYKTGLFVPDQSYQLSVIKTPTELAMKIIGDGKTLCHVWDISTVAPTKDGPFGIRQMWTKDSLYKNIQISTL